MSVLGLTCRYRLLSTPGCGCSSTPWRLKLQMSFQTSQGHDQSYSETVLLPKTPFPAKIEGQKRVALDQAIIKSPAFAKLYYKQKEHRSSAPQYVLHDGPPYANGSTHLGHAVNKILKDITVRWNIVKGQQVHFRPGWDCHGLPIELKALQSQEDVALAKESPVKLRQIARNFASETITKQKDEFLSWGVIGDWENPYTTMSPEFVKGELRAFHKLYEKGYVYQRYMPVYWSPSSQTALAESELEYKSDHVSTSVYARFPVKSNTYLLIWTTTPWSLASNRAVCYNPDVNYCVVVHSDGCNYILAERLLRESKDLKDIFGESPEIIKVAVGSEMFENETYSHCIPGCEGTMPILPASHVTLDAGTGLVHTAPAHGPEDYAVGTQHGLDLSCPIDELGRYNNDVKPRELVGKSVLGDGNEEVLKLLEQSGHLLKRADYVHSYPYDWRTKQPVILRASKQWFVDSKTLQQDALEAVKSIPIHPKTAVNGFKGVLERRPYWCISRQRVWGAPIPVFYHNDDVVINEELLDRYCSLIDKHGTDFWWTLSTEEILDTVDMENKSQLVKGTDILDVWFDSGMTWSSAIPEGMNGLRQSHVYLEGLDQFSGWFYSSLLNGLALQGASPYKNLFVHGFTLDEEGRKMSKSLGNVIAPDQITMGASTETNKKGKKSQTKKVYGVDVLRWWVAAHGSQNAAILVGDSLLTQTKQETDRLRNIFKFLLGNIKTVQSEKDLLSYDSLLPLDKLILHRLSSYVESVRQDYDQFAYNQVVLKTQNFVASTLSSFYFYLIKDRLYCDTIDSTSRKSAETVLWQILHHLKQNLHPILPILTQEVTSHLQHSNNVEIYVFDKLSDHNPWKNQALSDTFDCLTAIKEAMLSSLKTEDLKTYDILLKATDPRVGAAFKDFKNAELIEFFQSASLKLTDEDLDGSIEANGCEFAAVPTTLLHCPRCRLMARPNESGELCNRCQEVTTSLK